MSNTKAKDNRKWWVLAGATLTAGEALGEREPITQIVFIGSEGGVDSQWLEAHLEGKGNGT